MPDIGKVVTPQTAPIVLPTQTPTIDSTFGVSAGGAGTPAPTPAQQINVTVQGSVVSEQELVGTIMGAMNNKLRAGAKFFASAAAG